MPIPSKILRYGIASTLAGEIVAAMLDEKLAMLSITTHVTRSRVLQDLHNDFHDLQIERNDGAIQPAADWLNAYWLQGDGAAEPFDLHYRGTDFQIKVWKELRRVPYGQTIWYSELARRVEMPLAVRAVASAVGSNRHIVIVPCHRIVPKGGGIGQFGGGVPLKRKLLEHEGAVEPFSQPLAQAQLWK